MGIRWPVMIGAFGGQFKSSSLFERVAAAHFFTPLIADELEPGSLCRPTNGNQQSYSKVDEGDESVDFS